MPVKSPLMSLEKFRNTVATLRPTRAAIKAYSIMSCPDSSATIRLSRRIILDSSRRRGSCVACIALWALQVLCVETRVCSRRLPAHPRKVLKDRVGQGVADPVEGALNRIAEALHGADYAQGYQCGDQGILDQVLAGIVVDQLYNERFHCINLRRCSVWGHLLVNFTWQVQCSVQR